MRPERWPERSRRSSKLTPAARIHTAELCPVEPFDYLVALQRHTAAVLPEPAAWMPWNYTEALARAEANIDSARD